MSQDLSINCKGVFELDETQLGGVGSGGKRGWGAANKTCLFGIIERDGRVRVIPVGDRKGETLLPIIEMHIQKENTIVNTDGFRVYNSQEGQGYTHQ